MDQAKRVRLVVTVYDICAKWSENFASNLLTVGRHDEKQDVGQ